ncbi:MAG: DUF1573 domain-containing protein [Chitinophagaceae bacterium]|nr:DUF1573 domain-containing protein [Chitinophagaceae bacterium]
MIKQFLILVFLVLLSLPVMLSAQIMDGVKKKDKILVKETSFDFGKIMQGKPVFHDFQVVNLDTVPLVIDNVQASCGCTTPEWSREPIAPGGTSIIKVGYNSATPGYFEKTITLMYAKGMTSMVSIKGNVWKTPEQPAPFNKSIAFLKAAKF